MAHIAATGYVHELIDKRLSFEQFALSCARAFGALITMRDSPADAEIPEEFKPNTSYYEQSRSDAEGTLARLSAMTEAEREAFGAEKQAATIALYDKMQADAAGDIAICQEMLERVQGWLPPTREHDGLKQFMVEQIESSIRREGDSYYEHQRAEIRKRSPLSFFTEELSSAAWRIKTATEEIDKEIKRARERTQWVRDLRSSLQYEPDLERDRR